MVVKVKVTDAMRGGSAQWPFEDEPNVGTEIYCLHCGGSFLKGQEMADASDGLLVCPNGDCDGSPLDWSTEPWS